MHYIKDKIKFYSVYLTSNADIKIARYKQTSKNLKTKTFIQIVVCGCDTNHII